jgi:NitT/TauT family transport system permease protein
VKVSKVALKTLKTAYEKSLAIVVVLAIWETAPRVGLIDPHSLPPFSAVIKGLSGFVMSGRIVPHLQASLLRSLIGFLLAVFVAIPIGISFGWFKRAARIGDPLVQFSRNTPALALYPLFILIFGLGEFSKVAIIFWGTLWPILINTTDGVRSIDPLLIKSARSMKIGQFALFRKVVLPAAFPTIVTGLRLGATRSILLLVSAEMLGAKIGLGFSVFDFQQRDDIPEMYGTIIVLIVIGVITNFSLVHFEKKVNRWKVGLQAG